MSDLLAALTPGLEADPRSEAAPGDRLAAVLALIVDGAEPAVVFTERAAALSRHAGEVSFPGGLADPDDVDLRSTALRETEEELGIAPSVVAVAGALPPVHTFVSGVLVTPFVGVIPRLPAMTLSAAEVARVVVISLAALAAAEEQRVLREEGGSTWRGWWYVLPEATVWGATGFMVHALLDLVRSEAAWILD